MRVPYVNCGEYCLPNKHGASNGPQKTEGFNSKDIWHRWHDYSRPRPLGMQRSGFFLPNHSTDVRGCDPTQLR